MTWTKIRTLLAITTAAAILAVGVPARPAMANGAASTRNLILLGGAAAAYLIIQHNRKVHEQEAQAAARQAQAELQSQNAMAAYQQELRAYRAEVAANAALKREVAYQHSLVERQDRELASLSVHEHVERVGNRSVAMVSYGWGAL